MGGMKRTSQQFQPGIAIAALSVALNASGEIQLTPAGEFRGLDGRPEDAPAWVMDAQAANDVIAFCTSRQLPFVLDYEHQTLLKEANGQPAPAAGWFDGSDLVWRDGEGLFAKVALTERAKEFIGSGEYKFVSPVLYYKKGSGRIVGLHSAALTNTPNIDGMDEVIARAAAGFNFNDTAKEANSMDMDELIAQVKWLLGLPTLSTPEEVVAELQKLQAAIKADNATETAAANFSITGLLAGKDAQIAALSQAKVDLKSAQDELAALKQESANKEVSDVVEAALTAGKLLPAQKEAALAIGKTNLAALNQMIAASTPIAALTATQTGGDKPAGAVDLNDAVAMAAAAQKLMDEEAKVGRSISSAEAVERVKKQGN